ncbi:hypothetical protein N9242_08105, partial [Vicingaceae bacterium]|nr:hypothetical protein [Vicingaceae bacterium]
LAVEAAMAADDLTKNCQIFFESQGMFHDIPFFLVGEQAARSCNSVALDENLQDGLHKVSPVQITSTNRRGKSGRRVTTGTGRKLQLKR